MLTDSKGEREMEVLFCKSCGNDDRFIQVVSYETHLVNREFVHIRLLDSQIERYDCYVCGEEAESTLVTSGR